MSEGTAVRIGTSASRLSISVAMATFNGQKYIREQLDSIAGQELLPLELVITDDGSTDATLLIVDDFAQSAPFPVRVFRNENRLGYADNFLKAASLCQGDLIALCDQDDVWLENKLRISSAFFTDPGVVLAAHSAWTLLDSGEHGRLFPHFARTQVVNPGKIDPFEFSYGFAMLIRRELISVVEAALRPQRLLGHDQWFWFLAANIGSIAMINEPLTLYRQHQSNIFGARKTATTAEQAAMIANSVNYDWLADSESECARILLAAAERSPELGDQLLRSAERLKHRARLHRFRTRIYSRESGLLRRATTFSRIFLLGGYWPDSSRTRLGLHAAAKDMLFGVPGAHKLFARAHGPKLREK